MPFGSNASVAMRPASGRTNAPLLSCNGLSKVFPTSSGLPWRRATPVPALSDVSLEFREGETLAIVGESGSGKTTLSKILLGLLPATSGFIDYKGKPFTKPSADTRRSFRRDVQVIFQDPSASLNPRQTVGQAIGNILVGTGMAAKGEVRGTVEGLLEAFGLAPASNFVGRYPHELSGGQQQRVAIARAFAVAPRLIIADEPLASLDVSVRRQVLELMVSKQRETGVGYVIITHDLSMVGSVADWLAVMYRGRVVESGPASLIKAPRHPYTRMLVEAQLSANPTASRLRNRKVLPAEMPQAELVSRGCGFLARCAFSRKQCAEDAPALIVDSGGTGLACHFPEQTGH